MIKNSGSSKVTMSSNLATRQKDGRTAVEIKRLICRRKKRKYGQTEGRCYSCTVDVPLYINPLRRVYYREMDTACLFQLNQANRKGKGGRVG